MTPDERGGFLTSLDERDLRALTAAMSEGVVVVGPDLCVRDLNAAAATILGVSAAEILDRNVCGFFGKGACPQDTLAETLASGKPIVGFQTTVRLGDDQEGQVVLQTVPVGRGGVALLLGDVTEVTRLRRESSPRVRLGRLTGRDAKMQRLYDLIDTVAASDASVLIRGESGTGKELVALALHEGSGRSGGPFVKVNCSALAETLLESELFGHVRGAFTGAVSERRGRFEAAHGGTIFLDEIGDVSPAVQVKLLRVLQERIIERVGDGRPIAVDVRVVSATNRDLESLLASGRIREDFYYRIKVVRLDIPALRERREDIPLLVAELLARHGAPGVKVTPEAMSRLLRHAWPGNVRELENALEHALVLSRGGDIRSEHLPPEIGAGAASRGLEAVARGSSSERDLILAALTASGWNRTRAARKLGIDRTTLWRKINEHGLTPVE
jgi:two-component system, NtrC family, response regulator HydG